MDILRRFINSIEVMPNGCWNWTGAKNEKGYGYMVIDGHSIRVHRFSYMLFVGELIDELTIDHLCRNTSCVNPEHLEQVTNIENIRRGESASVINSRKTKCPKGHEYSGYNLIRTKRGDRVCRKCKNEYANRLYRRNMRDRPTLLKSAVGG